MSLARIRSERSVGWITMTVWSNIISKANTLLVLSKYRFQIRYFSLERMQTQIEYSAFEYSAMFFTFSDTFHEGNIFNNFNPMFGYQFKIHLKIVQICLLCIFVTLFLNSLVRNLSELRAIKIIEIKNVFTINCYNQFF